MTVVLVPNGPVIFDFPLCRFVRRRLVRFVTGVSVVFKNFQQDWLSNVRNDVLAGLVVALALIPEAIAFSIIAGVDPKVGLYASFSIATIIAFTGGRPGMISAATGAMALVMAATCARLHSAGVAVGLSGYTSVVVL